MSRSSVREAIQRLAAAGMLEVRHGSGTYVRASTPAAVLSSTELVPLLTPHNVIDLIELREIIEVGVVALVADRATPDELAAVESALDTHQRALVGDGSPIDADERFHLALAEATHNTAIVEVMGLLNSLFRHNREKTSRVPGANERAYAAHVQLLEAVQARDADRAQEAMLANMDLLRRNVVAEARVTIETAEQRGARRVGVRRVRRVAGQSSASEGSDRPEARGSTAVEGQSRQTQPSGG